MMLKYILRLDRTEGAQAHMEGDKSGFDALCPDFIKQLLGEVQTGGGGRGGANLPRVNRLITLLIL